MASLSKSKMASETIALFGATGRTGSEFLRLAIGAGHPVRALVRTPSKIDASLGEHPSLTIKKGSLTDIYAVKDVVDSSKYVVCMAANTHIGLFSGGSYPTDTMINFVRSLVPIMEESGTVKVFYYQAGAFCPAPGTEPLPFVARLLRDVVFKGLMGGGPLLEDHGKVIDYLCTEVDDKKSFKFIVSRPGQLLSGPPREELTGTPQAPRGGVTYADVAKYALSALEDESLYGTFYTPMPKSTVSDSE